MIVHPEGPGRDFLIIISVLLGIATIAIILRLLARLEIRAFGIDDWLMLAGWVGPCTGRVYRIADISRCSLSSAASQTTFPSRTAWAPMRGA